MCYHLRELRKKRGLSQRALAKLLHVSQSAYSRYERGQRSPTIETVYTLAQLFHVSVDYLAGITDDPHPHWGDSANR